MVPIIPIIKPPIKLPGILPIPPKTTTMMAMMVYCIPIVGIMVTRILKSVPAKPAIKAPRPKHKASTRLMFTPMILAVAGSWAAALMALPVRERTKKR